MLKLCALLLFGVVQVWGICPPGEDYWPHRDCTKYWVCNHGIPILSDCPGGLYWNQAQTTCDFPAYVPECVGGTRDPEPTTTELTTTTSTTTEAPETTTEEPVVTTTESPETTTEEPVVTSTESPETTTEEPVVTSTEAPETTTEEPVVTTTEAPETTTEEPVVTTTERTTTTTQSTSPDTATPETEPTLGPTTTEPPSRCPAEGVAKISHEEFCNMYYLCFNGDILGDAQTCVSGLLFDSDIGECNHAENVECGDLVIPTTMHTTTTTIRTTEEEPITSSTESPWPEECPDTGIIQLPFPGNCTLYRMCIDGYQAVYRCPQGHLFDTERRECLPEDEAVCTVEDLLESDDENEAPELEEGEQIFTVQNVKILPNNAYNSNYLERMRRAISAITF